MSMRLFTCMFFTSTLSESLMFSNVFFLIIYLNDSEAVGYFRTVSLHRKEKSLYFKKIVSASVYLTQVSIFLQKRSKMYQNV